MGYTIVQNVTPKYSSGEAVFSLPIEDTPVFTPVGGNIIQSDSTKGYVRVKSDDGKFLDFTNVNPTVSNGNKVYSNNQIGTSKKGDVKFKVWKSATEVMNAEEFLKGATVATTTTTDDDKTKKNDKKVSTDISNVPQESSKKADTDLAGFKLATTLGAPGVALAGRAFQIASIDDRDNVLSEELKRMKKLINY